VYAVETNGLTKYYSRGKIQALDDFSIKIEKGQIFSLLGPNGAGKTTLIKLLTGIVQPTRGTADILGSHISDFLVHAKIGYLAENHRFPDFLSAGQILYYYGKMAGMEASLLRDRIPMLLHEVKLGDWIHTKIRKYSKGMLQRLGLAHALIHDPELLFLDEPTDGIDPIGRREIRDLLKSLRDKGKTIFLNSHLLSEVERTSDRIAILQNGKLIRQGLVSEFTLIEQQYQLHLSNAESAMKRICTQLNITYTKDHHIFTVILPDLAKLNLLIDRLRSEKIVIEAVMPRKISLEDFFIDILDQKAGDGK
jgi:ABC-2 type transport system ATP-binding protein